MTNHFSSLRQKFFFHHSIKVRGHWDRFILNSDFHEKKSERRLSRPQRATQDRLQVFDPFLGHDWINHHRFSAYFLVRDGPHSRDFVAAGITAWLVIRRSWVHIPAVLPRIKASESLSRKIYAFSPFSTILLVYYLCFGLLHAHCHSRLIQSCTGKHLYGKSVVLHILVRPLKGQTTERLRKTEKKREIGHHRAGFKPMTSWLWGVRSATLLQLLHLVHFSALREALVL